MCRFVEFYSVPVGSFYVPSRRPQTIMPCTLHSARVFVWTNAATNWRGGGAQKTNKNEFETKMIDMVQWMLNVIWDDNGAFNYVRIIVYSAFPCKLCAASKNCVWIWWSYDTNDLGIKFIHCSDKWHSDLLLCPHAFATAYMYARTKSFVFFYVRHFWDINNMLILNFSI